MVASLVTLGKCGDGPIEHGDVLVIFQWKVKFINFGDVGEFVLWNMAIFLWNMVIFQWNMVILSTNQPEIGDTNGWYVNVYDLANHQVGNGNNMMGYNRIYKHQSNMQAWMRFQCDIDRNMIG